MLEFKKLQKWMEVINNTYAFALLVYGFLFWLTSQSFIFLWFLIIATPVITGWGGYLLHSFMQQRNQRHGFKLISDVVSYEIGNNHRYTLRYQTTIKAAANHLMVYPIGYKWTGNGVEGVPKVKGKGQQLLTLVRGATKKSIPYQAAVMSSDGDWHYWFIALNPPNHKGDVTEIKYSQEFYDKKNITKTHLGYFVRVPMERLELNIKFPAHVQPKEITSIYIKSSDTSRPYAKPGVVYDADKQWATWVIEKPKKGYYYRIHWH